MNLQSLWRYPVKGLQGESLSHVDIAAGKPIPFDRCFALAHGDSDISSNAPMWALKTSFHMLMHKGDRRLAALKPLYDEKTGCLTIYCDGKEVLKESVLDAEFGPLVEQFFADYLVADCPTGLPKLAHSQSVRFGNIEEPVISLINLASVRDISRAVGQDVDAARFRGNFVTDGGEPWVERQWVGRTIKVSGIRFSVHDETIRCGATLVNPTTFERDLNIPQLLHQHFGHLYCGIYLIAADDGAVAVGNEITIE